MIHKLGLTLVILSLTISASARMGIQPSHHGSPSLKYTLHHPKAAFNPLTTAGVTDEDIDPCNFGLGYWLLGAAPTLGFSSGSNNLNLGLQIQSALVLASFLHFQLALDHVYQGSSNTFGNQTFKTRQNITSLIPSLYFYPGCCFAGGKVFPLLALSAAVGLGQYSSGNGISVSKDRVSRIRTFATVGMMVELTQLWFIGMTLDILSFSRDAFSPIGSAGSSVNTSFNFAANNGFQFRLTRRLACGTKQAD